MLYGLLVALFLFVCFLLIALILIQQTKGSMGLGGLGGSTQMLFGGSGGQDVFQKSTWILGALFMIGSLSLTVAKTRQAKTSQYFNKRTTQSAPMARTQEAPAAPEQEVTPETAS